MTAKKQKTVSLVLGSGGARGLAHIGVIRWLTDNGFVINSISGCSIGALIGGVYAAGKLDELESWLKDLETGGMLALLDLSWSKSGLVKGDKIMDKLKSFVGDAMIEDLPINYTAVAADILNEKEVWINSGELFNAIRASISLPLFFTPFKYNGVDLIDGGVLNPVPIAPTFNDATDLTIAVNLGARVDDSQKAKLDCASADGEPSFTDKVVDFFDSLNGSSSSANDWGVHDIANQAFDAMQSTIARQKLAAYPPSHSVEIARNACGILEFDCAEEMIKLGYEKAQEYLHSAI